MSYEQYRGWCGGLTNQELNAEIVKLRGRRGQHPTNSRAYKAWDTMLQTAENVARSRDTTEISQVNAYLGR
jgi:hypothetical protein